MHPPIHACQKRHSHGLVCRCICLAVGSSWYDVFFVASFPFHVAENLCVKNRIIQQHAVLICLYLALAPANTQLGSRSKEISPQCTLELEVILGIGATIWDERILVIAEAFKGMLQCNLTLVNVRFFSGPTSYLPDVKAMNTMLKMNWLGRKQILQSSHAMFKEDWVQAMAKGCDTLALHCFLLRNNPALSTQRDGGVAGKKRHCSGSARTNGIA